MVTSSIHASLVLIALANIILWDRMSARLEKLQVYVSLGIRRTEFSSVCGGLCTISKFVTCSDSTYPPLWVAFDETRSHWHFNGPCGPVSFYLPSESYLARWFRGRFSIRSLWTPHRVNFNGHFLDYRFNVISLPLSIAQESGRIPSTHKTIEC